MEAPYAEEGLVRSGPQAQVGHYAQVSWEQTEQAAPGVREGEAQLVS